MTLAGIGGWLLKNPLAGLSIVLALGLGLQTLRLSWSETALAKEQLAFTDFKKDLAQKSLKVVQDAAKKSDEQITKLTDEVRSIGLVGQQAKTEIRYVRSNGGPCGDDPVYRATVGGMQRVLDAGSAGGDKGAPLGKPASVVRRAPAP